MNKLDVATIKQLFPKVEGLPTEEGWHLFIPRNASNWIIPCTFVFVAFNKGALCAIDDGECIPFKNWSAGEWHGPIPLNQIAEILKDD